MAYTYPEVTVISTCREYCSVDSYISRTTETREEEYKRNLGNGAKWREGSKKIAEMIAARKQ